MNIIDDNLRYSVKLWYSKDGISMEAKRAGKIGVIFPSGTVHRETGDQFMQLFENMLNTDVEVIVISFCNVKALLSDGIRLSIAIADAARSAGKKFHITDLPKEVKYTLQITNLINILGYEPSLFGILQKQGFSENDLITVADQTEEKIAPKPLSPPPPPPAKKEEPKVEKSAVNTLKSMSSLRDEHRISTRRLLRLTDKELQHAIKTYIPGRIALKIIEYMISSQKNVINADDIAHHLREEKKVIIPQLKKMLSLGTIKLVGGAMFNFDPSEEVRQQISAVLRLYNHRETHSKILKFLLNAES